MAMQIAEAVGHKRLHLLSHRDKEGKPFTDEDEARAVQTIEGILAEMKVRIEVCPAWQEIAKLWVNPPTGRLLEFPAKAV